MDRAFTNRRFEIINELLARSHFYFNKLERDKKGNRCITNVKLSNTDMHKFSIYTLLLNGAKSESSELQIINPDSRKEGAELMYPNSLQRLVTDLF